MCQYGLMVCKGIYEIAELAMLLLKHKSLGRHVTALPQTGPHIYLPPSMFVARKGAPVIHPFNHVL